MKTALLLVAAAAVLAAIGLVWRRRVAATPNPRAQQQTEGGKPIVDEWGEESFPASDPPQSW